MFTPVTTVLFRSEVLVQPGASPQLVPDAPGALATLRFIGVRTLIRPDAATRAYCEKSGLAALADAVITTPLAGSPDVLVVGSDAGAITAALAAGCRAALLGAAVVSGAHRVSDLAAVVELVRGESVETRRASGFNRQTRNLVADFRGLPSEYSRAEERPMAKPNGIAGLLLRANDGDASALKSLAALARGVVVAEETGLDAREEILDAWPLVVPAKLRQVCFPVDLMGDVLVLLCSTPVARNEMNLMERALITAIRRLPGCSGVNRVAYRM